MGLPDLIQAVIGSGPYQKGLRSRQPADGALTSLASIANAGAGIAYMTAAGQFARLVLAADRGIYASSATVLATYVLTSFGRTLGGSANAGAARTTLGLGGAAVLNVGVVAGTVMAGDDSRVVAVGQLVDSSLTATVTTTDGAPTVCGSITPADGACVTLTATVSGAGTGTGAGYVIVGTFRRSGGTTTQVGATSVVHSAEDVAGWGAAYDISGAVVRVVVTGALATTVGWRTRIGVVT
jgi:hypothetical protein